MNSNGITILYKNSFVILHFFGVFNIVMFLYRNNICFLMIMCAIVIAQFYCQISIFRLIKNGSITKLVGFRIPDIVSSAHVK